VQAVEELAKPRLEKLIADLEERGVLRSPEWRTAFRGVYRHRFVPRVFRYTGTDWEVLDGRRPEQFQEWLDIVYRDEVLVTQVSDGSPAVATSSSTLPSLMAEMLEALDVADNQCVLEIGTGTGYNAALLSERLGGAQVTTIDIDAALVAAARDRLAAHGHKPVLAVANGSDGYPPGAPFDRIICTCGTRYIPGPWVRQVRPGGVIVANVRGTFDGGVVRLEVRGSGSAHGRFLSEPWCFLPIREGGALSLDFLSSPQVGGPDEGTRRQLTFPVEVFGSAFWFLVVLHLPYAFLGQMGQHDHPSGLYLVEARDGSWAQVDPPKPRGLRLHRPRGCASASVGDRRAGLRVLEAAGAARTRPLRADGCPGREAECLAR
jgi:protein-L-isoaspartate O-methyltransferase